MYGLRRFGIILGLETIKRILSALGNPQGNFASIHVAGTNGKGSVASSLSSILHQSGYKVGLYTSPHLVRFNERICINCHGRPADLRRLGAEDNPLVLVEAGVVDRAQLTGQYRLQVPVHRSVPPLARLTAT